MNIVFITNGEKKKAKPLSGWLANLVGSSKIYKVKASELSKFEIRNALLVMSKKDLVGCNIDGEIKRLMSMGCFRVNENYSYHDKINFLLMCLKHNILTPETHVIERHTDLSRFSWPMICKLPGVDKGEGVFWIGDENSLRVLFGVHPKEEYFILQKPLMDSLGRDIRALVVDGRVFVAYERIADEGFKANVSQGGKSKLVVLTKEEEAFALRIAKICGMEGLSGIDLIRSGGKTYAIEINSSPGTTALQTLNGGMLDKFNSTVANMVQKRAKV